MSRTLIPDTPGYLVLVGDDGKEWHRLACVITWRHNPETRRTLVVADFDAFDVKPPLKKREYRRFRIEYRDAVGALLLAGDWSRSTVGRKDTVRVSDFGGTS